jgi:hypothetical protein
MMPSTGLHGCHPSVSNRIFVDLRFSFGVRFGTGVTICLGPQETKVLVRSRWWLEDGGGLPSHWILSTQRLPSESLYVSDPKRLRSSSGHGGGWRTGVDFHHTGSFPHSVYRLSCPWGRDRSREFVSGSYSFPQHCMTYRLSVGGGVFTNLFLDW